MNLFLLLTAMLSALTGVGRAVDAGARVEASRVVAVAQAVVPSAASDVAPRPDGYVAPEPLVLDLAYARAAAPRVVPERRRE
ncbi:hypothetical protein [Sphingomonas sp. RS2018]